jgi:8-amino-7-oxononanoate synthase
VRRAPEALAAALREVDDRRLRRRRVVAAPVGPEAGAGAPPVLAIDGRRYLNFCSNDYLGLATHPALANAMAACASATGAGAGASHLVSGHGPEHEALERELAEFTGRERALLFSTGYMANLGVAAALADRDDLVLGDRLNHASLVDAALLARTRRSLRYAHGDAPAARAALAAHAAATPAAGALLLTDGVFSMDGDLAPLPALAAAARAHGAWLVVDDAHGLGAIGPGGGGSVAHFGLGAGDVPVLVGTLGKAFGSFGAFVAGSAELIELLVQRARTYIYTTALPQPVAAATRTALRLVATEGWRREKLAQLVARFRELATARGLPLLDSPTAIQPVIFGAESAALAASESLREAGFWVGAIRPPTVPAGTARLRITLSAAHREADVEALVEALARAAEQAAHAAPTASAPTSPPATPATPAERAAR